MIQYKDLVFEDYFIDEETAIITDNLGNVIQQKLHQGRPYVMINGMRLAVHCIQVHTKYGYNPDLIVHHDDRNPKNNALENLLYITPSKHTEIHKNDMHTDEMMDNLKERMKNNKYVLGKHWKLSPETRAKMSAAVKRRYEKYHQEQAQIQIQINDIQQINNL